MDHATTESTARLSARWKKKLSTSAFRQLGRTNWQVSEIGFGCYRIDAGIPEHEKALAKALRAGCNLVDTSTNYTDGGSETAVGEVLETLVSERALSREEVVLVSKVGYVQGHNLELAQTREEGGRPYPEMIKYMEGCWHCIHPEFIEEQLSMSLQRMKQSCVDVYLLHNPEYFFSDAKQRRSKEKLPALRSQFYERIRAAFKHLESEVKKGRICCYGVSSNTFGSPSEDPEATSLTEMWNIAESLSKNHHFSVIQCPMNLFEGGPVLEKNNGASGSETLLEAAQRLGLGVLVNRPLNAAFGNQMVRLADFPVRDVGDTSTQLKKVALLEAEFVESIAPHLHTGSTDHSPKDFFRWGAELANPQLQAMSLEHWQEVEFQMVRPQLQNVLNFLNEQIHGELMSLWEKWRQRYSPELEKLFLCFRSDCAKRSQKISATISKRLEPFLSDELKGEPLSRKSLAILANTEGVHCVLNGMRQMRYVEDSLGCMKLPPFTVDKKLFEAFRLGK